MRAITATLKSIRTSTSPYTPTQPVPPPTLYTMNTPTSTSSLHTTSSPYTPQASSRISALTSTKTKAPSGLALQQKKIENQRRANLLAGSPPTSSSLKQSVPPSRPTLSTVSRSPVNISFSSPVTNSKSSSSNSMMTSSPSSHRRSRSSGNLYSSTSSLSNHHQGDQNVMLGVTSSPSLSSSSPYSAKTQTYMNMTSSHAHYTSSLASPSASALLRSKTPPPRRMAEEYMSSTYMSGTGYYNNFNVDYQKTSARYLKT